MTDLKWIKITVGMMDDNKIGYLKTLPAGDSIIVFWLEILSISAKSSGDGYLFVAPGVPYTEASLSKKLNRKVSFIKAAIKALMQLKMVDVDDGFLHITNWYKYQNFEGMEKVREQGRNRQTALRERKKAEIFAAMGNENVTLHDVTNNVTGNATETLRIVDANGHSNVTGNVTGNVTVTLRDVTRDVIRDVTDNVTVTQSNATELELELELKDKTYIGAKAAPASLSNLVAEVITYLNEKADKAFKFPSKTADKLIGARIKDGYGIEDFRHVIDTKCADWVNDPAMNKFLRPETLFSSKFESYLNEKPVGKPPAGPKPQKEILGNGEPPEWFKLELAKQAARGEL